MILVLVHSNASNARFKSDCGLSVTWLTCGRFHSRNQQELIDFESPTCPFTWPWLGRRCGGHSDGQRRLDERHAALWLSGRWSAAVGYGSYDLLWIDCARSSSEWRTRCSSATWRTTSAKCKLFMKKEESERANVAIRNQVESVTLQMQSNCDINWEYVHS